MPEAVLGRDVALREEDVVDAGGMDGGDAVAVAGDGDGGSEAGDLEGAVELRKRGAHGVAEVERGAEGREDREDEEDF